jgi:hypothetical protein
VVGLPLKPTDLDYDRAQQFVAGIRAVPIDRSHLRRAIVQNGVVMVSFNVPCGGEKQAGSSTYDYDVPSESYCCPNAYSHSDQRYPIRSAHAVLLYGWGASSSTKPHYLWSGPKLRTQDGGQTYGTGTMTMEFAETFLKEAFVIENVKYPLDICTMTP